jgi:hypothetical protein
MKKRLYRPMLVLVLGCLMCPGLSRAETIYLDADFDSKTPNEPIGSGGAAVGEPFYLDGFAGGYIREFAPPNRVLEIQDGSTSAYCNIWFSFVDGVELDSGILVVTFTIEFYETGGGSSHRVTIREGSGGGFEFAVLDFREDYAIELSDHDGVVGVIGYYNMSVRSPIAIAFDLTAGTYDVWLDGQEVRSDEPITTSGEKLGYIVFSTGPDEDLEGRYFIDDLFVTDNPNAVPVEDCTWGRVKGLFR